MRFFSPQFFWLLPLAAIPFIIHLLSRLRLRRKEFPSLLLLQTVRRERFSWLRLKELILLVLRTLTLLLLLFALTRPYLPVRSPGFLRTERLLLILDDSYSMGYGDRWHQALAACRQISKLCSRPYLLLASQPETLFAGQTAVHNILDTIKPSALAPLLYPALNRAAAFVNSSPMPVVLITDLQERTFPDSLPANLIEFLEVINVGGVRFENAGIARVYLEDNTIKAEIANHSNSAISRIVQLKIGNHLEEQAVDLKPRTKTKINFSYHLEKPGTYTGTVELVSDSLVIDNIRYFAFTIPKQTRVPIFASAAVPGDYIYLALLADTTLFQPFLVDITQLRKTELRKYPVIIITDAGALQGADFDRLEFYLHSGGSALVCAAPTLPENSGLGRYLKLIGQAQPAGFVTVSEVDTSHPVLDIFRKTDLAQIRVFRYSRFAGAHTLVQLSSGDPLILELLEKPVIIWSFAPVPEATDLVYKAAFAPLLHRTLAHLTSLALKSEFTAGETIRLDVASSRTHLLSTPVYERSLTPEPALPRPYLLITETKSPGIYKVINSDTLTIVVNPLPEEGDLTPVPLSQVSKKGIKVRTGSGAAITELAQWLFYLAAFCFFLEMLILALERNQRKMPV